MIDTDTIREACDPERSPLTFTLCDEVDRLRVDNTALRDIGMRLWALAVAGSLLEDPQWTPIAAGLDQITADYPTHSALEATDG